MWLALSPMGWIVRQFVGLSKVCNGSASLFNLRHLSREGGTCGWLLRLIRPPSAIVHTNHGEILISRHKSTDGGDRVDMSKPIASAATLALCGDSGAGDDPWIQSDPWKSFRPSTNVAPTSSATMHQMESRIQAAVLSKIPQAMEDDTSERIGLLEGQVQQLIQKQSCLDTQFNEFAVQQGQTVAGLQNQINVQSQQMHGQLEAQSQNIQAMFETQLTHIRGLLSKRPREDGE